MSSPWLLQQPQVFPWRFLSRETQSIPKYCMPWNTSTITDGAEELFPNVT